VITDAQGTVLAVHTTPANVRDDQAVPALLGRVAGDHGPRRPPASLHGDAAYGFPHTARRVVAAGVEPVLAARGSPGPRPRRGSSPGGVAKRPADWGPYAGS
jgi:hypothetical protein